jgi:hypothetical protein
MRRFLGRTLHINLIIKNIHECYKQNLPKIVCSYLMSSCVNWASETSVLKAHECQKRTNLHTNELNTTFFCSMSPLKAPHRLKSLKFA